MFLHQPTTVLNIVLHSRTYSLRNVLYGLLMPASQNVYYKRLPTQFMKTFGTSFTSQVPLYDNKNINNDLPCAWFLQHILLSTYNTSPLLHSHVFLHMSTTCPHALAFHPAIDIQTRVQLLLVQKPV